MLSIDLMKTCLRFLNGLEVLNAMCFSMLLHSNWVYGSTQTVGGSIPPPEVIRDSSVEEHLLCAQVRILPPFRLE